MLMKETISLIDTTTTISSLREAVNRFERIGNAMPDQWLPYYYCAYCCARISHMEKTDKKRDLYVDQAEYYINMADKIDPENSEICVMQGFILQARMDIDPMVRGMKYNNKCLEMFEKAREIDPENPRSYLWYGVNLFNTPSFFGGGKEKALPLLEKSLEKFNSFVPESLIHPDWGREYAELMLEKY